MRQLEHLEKQMESREREGKSKLVEMADKQKKKHIIFTQDWKAYMNWEKEIRKERRDAVDRQSF